MSTDMGNDDDDRLREADAAVKSSTERLRHALQQRVKVDKAVEGMERQHRENHYADLITKAFKR